MTASASPEHFTSRDWRVVLPLAILSPIVLAFLLRGVPQIDERWENRPAHFWLVLLTALLCLALAIAISEGGRRRRDARLLLIGLAFVVSAGFLGLHALATPGVIVEGKNAGFVLATPVGLVLAGAFAAASAVEFRVETSLSIVRHGRLLLALVLLVLASWAAVSVAGLPPLHHPVTPAQIETPLAFVAAVGVVFYGFAAVSYLRVYSRRGSGLAFAVAFAFALLAEALVVVVVSLPTSWQVSWWEWHALMLLGFAAIGVAAAREWHEERFSALYLDETLRGHKDVSVLFADLAGFTSFTELRGSDEVHTMLLAYFGAPRTADPGRIRRRGTRIRRRPDLRRLQQGRRPAGPCCPGGQGSARPAASGRRGRGQPSGLAVVSRGRKQRRRDRRRGRRPRSSHPRRPR